MISWRGVVRDRVLIKKREREGKVYKRPSHDDD